MEFFVQSNLPIGKTRSSPPGSLKTQLDALQAQASLPAGDEGFYLNRFETQRLDIPYRSAFTHQKPAHPARRQQSS